MTIEAENNEVVALLKSLFSYEREIDNETRLFHDLDIYGDDVDMLFMVLEDDLSMNISGVDLDKYFYMSELPSFGIGIIDRILGRDPKTIRDPSKKPPVRVRHLVRAIELGSLKKALEE